MRHPNGVVPFLLLVSSALATAPNPSYLFPIPILNGFTTTSPPPGFTAPLLQVALNDKAIGASAHVSGVDSPVVTGPDNVQAYEADYPKGSYKPSAEIKGGFGFYFDGPTAFGGFENHDQILFSYSVYFPQDFDWVLGGKMPGPYGGVSLDEAHACSGGRQEDRDKCFSLRLMWRERGDGEIYAYLPKTNANNDSTMLLKGTIIEDDYGISIARGAFQFKAGDWTTVAQRVRMNTNGQTDGELELWVDGKSVIHATGLEIRVNPETTFRGIHAQTFFGGSNTSWATPVDQKVYFTSWSGAILAAGSSPADGQPGYPLIPSPPATGTAVRLCAALWAILAVAGVLLGNLL